MNTILIGTDGSRGASAAVELGVELASATGAAVVFVAVRQPPSPLFGDPHWQHQVSDELARLRPALTNALKVAEREGVAAEYELVEGDAAEELVHLAGERNADLVVVGSRGRGGFASTVLGSVSRRVVQEADRPVLVAKQRAAVPLPLAV